LQLSTLSTYFKLVWKLENSNSTYKLIDSNTRHQLPIVENTGVQDI